MSDGLLVGGQPEALLAASSSMYELANRTDDVGWALARALAPAASTIASAAPFAPMRAAAVLAAVERVLASPAAGLVSVAAAYEGASLQLRGAGQALEAAGAVGLMARGGLGLLRGERPSILDSTEGVDLRREAVTGSVSVGPLGGSGSLALRQVQRPDGTPFYVVEWTTSGKHAASAGIQVNGVGAFAEATRGVEITARWAVGTRSEAELLLAAIAASMAPLVGAAVRLPNPTESAVARAASAGVVGSIGPVPGLSSASGSVAIRSEVTTTHSGSQTFAASISGAGQLGLLGVAGTGGAGSVRVSVTRNPSGAITRASLSTTTEIDRGRHGNPLIEAGNREGTLVEQEWAVELTPERRAAADRVARAVSRGEAPDRADLEALGEAARNPTSTVNTYGTRHQQLSADVAAGECDGGGGVAVDTAVRRDPGGLASRSPDA